MLHPCPETSATSWSVYRYIKPCASADVFEVDSHLKQLEQMLVDEKGAAVKAESILFGGTRLRCEDLESMLDTLMTKHMGTTFHFRDDVFDAMSEVRQHEQLLCSLEEYIEADLPAKERFLTVNCAHMRTLIVVMMNYLKAQMQSTFDVAAQTDHVLGPYRRNLARAKKTLRNLHHFLVNPSNELDVDAKLAALDAAMAHAHEHDFTFDPTVFNFGREALVDGMQQIVDEWTNVARQVRTFKRIHQGLSPATSPLSINSTS
ncbi:hypothetical protein DYB30_004004 [Aphanomyces astaci]|uniref:Uncharacterized protein n=1 Tax=Aphanomyces astaci TaxID=112090 RepID=A0A397AMG3_APHAT|nr:hypothetical protein DYB36_014258 [Aphanomyces astaci]RHY40793.1 hypothetical protein DYB30_004004 [Aphanomyces astaci]RHY47666.1 hypothetical protein DYB38_001857 [Aphanomyces astaci]RHY66484.1 hypothetical protein DYB34_008607 [Aphanomyces astaci]RHY85610.1 hypothetical protein DYB26_004730 [Aphanomyces astaci]